MNSRIASVALIVLVLAVAAPARAGLVLSVEAPGVQSSQVAGVTTENFDAFPVDFLDAPTATAVGTIVPGSDTKIEAAAAFGGAGGSGNYLRLIAASEATLNLSGPQAYFGFWWSAADPGNTVELYSGGSLLGMFNASTTLAALSNAYKGNPNPGGGAPEEYFVYLNFIGTGGTTFDKIVFKNSVVISSFEMDNFSIRATAPDPIPGTIIAGGVTVVPEPSTLMLAGTGVAFAGLALGRRRRRASA